MSKSEILNWLRDQNQNWDALLDEIGSARMEQRGVNGDWSMKDIVAHLTGWNRKLLADWRAAERGDAEPPPPWPAALKDEDDINAWIYAAGRGRSLKDVLDETRQINQQLLAGVARLPEDVRMERVEPAFYLVWIGETRLQPGEFFDHFRVDHEADVRAWMAREGMTLPPTRQ